MCFGRYQFQACSMPTSTWRRPAIKARSISLKFLLYLLSETCAVDKNAACLLTYFLRKVTSLAMTHSQKHHVHHQLSVTPEPHLEAGACVIQDHGELSVLLRVPYWSPR